MAAAVAINSVGRVLIMLERRTAALREQWTRGFLVDCLESVLIVPLLAVLLLGAGSSQTLVVVTMGSLLAALMIAQRNRDLTAAALAAEQANARRDQLTGAPNRRAFEEAMEAEHARVVRGALPAGLYVIDLDRFKSINDRFGHKVGDEVLVEVVRRLTESLRPSDIVARWGGEEITVLAPGVRGRRQLEQFGERIRMVIREAPIATATTAVPPPCRSAERCSTAPPPLTALHRPTSALRGEADAGRDIDRDARLGQRFSSRAPRRSAQLGRPVRTGQRGDQAEADEDRARDVTLNERPAAAVRAASLRPCLRPGPRSSRSRARAP